MENKFKYSNDNKRYHTFNYYLKNKYKSKVAKIPLDAGFSCPNRDGSKGVGGCIFCSSLGSGEFTLKIDDIRKQFDDNKRLIENKWNDCKYIAYFQSFSNTYGPICKIKSMLEPFIYDDEVVAISIATRSDCLDDEKIEYLNSLTKYKDIWLEIGVQTTNDKTALFINRGHDFKNVIDIFEKLKNTNIKKCVHIINGLPNESYDDMIKTIKDVNNLQIDGIKIHALSILKNTALEKIYNNKPFHILTRDEYVNIVCDQLRYLNEEVVIQRLTEDPLISDLIEPKWLIKKISVLNEVDKKMKKDDIYQGELV